MAPRGPNFIGEADILSWRGMSGLMENTGFALESAHLVLGGAAPGCPQFDKNYVIGLQSTQLI